MDADIGDGVPPQHPDKEAQTPARRTDGDRTEVAPVHLSALARSELQHQEGGFAHGTHLADELLEDAVAASITLAAGV